MEVRPMTEEQKKEYGTGHGLYISNMNSRRLYQRGIDNGYVILEVNGKEVDDLSDIKGINASEVEDLLLLSPSGEKKMLLLQY
jgi:hypothetical protein